MSQRTVRTRPPQTARPPARSNGAIYTGTPSPVSAPRSVAVPPPAPVVWQPAPAVGVRPRKSARPWYRSTPLIVVGGAVLLGMATLLAVFAGGIVIYGSGRILPGVSVAGVALGGLDADSARAQLQSAWKQITIRDGSRTWAVEPSRLGLTFDAAMSARAAMQAGRSSGAWLSALFAEPVAPVVTFDPVAARQGLSALADSVSLSAQNATVRIEAGRAVAVPAVAGRTLDVTTTLQQLAAAPGAQFASGTLDLSMTSTQPTVSDASPLLQQAQRVLSAPLTINAFDPIQNTTAAWSIPVAQWGNWLTTQSGSSGVQLTVETNALSNFLTAQNQALPNGKHVDVPKSVTAAQAAVAAGQNSVTVQVLHPTTRYVVEPGDTIGTISWAQGIQMWRIQKTNPGLDVNSLSVGQTITLPSKDDLMPLPIIYNKRIVISISKQHMTVYENGGVKWDWVASTGISDSPTMPGIYQVQLHDDNAYAGNWNLWMPHFMGVYEAVPGFMNGIHGFPTRDGVGLLWQGDLGHKVTYGCILLSTTNAGLLYNWAQDGVVVEIQA